MKLVASSKLHKAEADIEAIRPYEQTLEDILRVVESYRTDEEGFTKASDAPVAVVAFSSNSSLCGAFNANAVHKTLETCAGCGSVKVIPVGRKMAEAMKKCGYDAEDDHGDIIGKPDYYKSRTLARELRRRFAEGEFSKVLLVYNRYVSSSSQVPVDAAVLDSAAAEHAARTVAMQTASENAERLLAELTLEYNKGRQEKITSEILDLESGEGGE